MADLFNLSKLFILCNNLNKKLYYLASVRIVRVKDSILSSK